jgi:hypothetical protein
MERSDMFKSVSDTYLRIVSSKAAHDVEELLLVQSFGP